MKHIKPILAVIVILSFSLQFYAQQAYLVHQDNVKPSKIMQYEKIAKEFHEACLEYQPKTTWMTASSNNFNYFYLTPIENMAQLDENPMKDMAESMGDKFVEMFQEFDKCYDSHGSYVIMSDAALSYMPENVTIPEDHNYRRWFYIYYTPENAKAVRDGMKAVKALHEKKDSKGYYRVYRDGLGQMENYYLVSVAAKDEIDFAQSGKEDEEILGNFEERWAAFSQVMDHTTKMEEYVGEMRPDLSYAPKEE